MVDCFASSLRLVLEQMVSFSGFDQHWPVGEPFEGWFEKPERGFRWALPERYHAIVTSARWPGPWLVPQDPDYRSVATNVDRHWVDVIGDPKRSGFHRKFARLAVDDQGRRMAAVLRFANVYGWLDPRRLTPSRAMLVRNDPGATESPFGESLLLWDQEIFRVAVLVGLWDLVRLRDRTALARIVDLSPYEAYVRCAWIDGRIAPLGPTPGHAAGQLFASVDGDYRPDNVIEPARRCLAHWLNREMEGELSPQLDPDGGRDYRIVPHTLSGAAYAHLLHDIAGRRRGPIPCACPECPREQYFVPRKKGQRFCSEQCRKLDNYHRKKDGGQPTPLRLVNP